MGAPSHCFPTQVWIRADSGSHSEMKGPKQTAAPVTQDSMEWKLVMDRRPLWAGNGPDHRNRINS